MSKKELSYYSTVDYDAIVCINCGPGDTQRTSNKSMEHYIQYYVIGEPKRT